MTLAFCFALGLAFGSFANVYLYRYPRDLSLWRPGSKCPHCDHFIRWYDNVPLFSYFLLSGKCRQCNAQISLQYPSVELLGGAVFVAVAYRFNTADLFVLAPFLFFAFLLFLMGATDVVTFFEHDREYGIIPDPLVLMLMVGGLAFGPFNPLLADSASITDPASLSIWETQVWKLRLALGLAGSAGGLVFMGGFRWLGEKLFNQESLGIGDIKLVGAAGIWLGWKGVLFMIIAGSLVGSVISVSLIALNKMDRRSPVPFGPFLSLGAIAALFYIG